MYEGNKWIISNEHSLFDHYAFLTQNLKLVMPDSVQYRPVMFSPNL